MNEERRSVDRDRRAHSRTGRRAHDGRKPWYLRRRLWLATASVVFMGWKRVRAMVERSHHTPGPGVGG